MLQLEIQELKALFRQKDRDIEILKKRLPGARTSTALGAFYRRLAILTSKAKATTATARKIAILFYNAMRFGMKYQDPEADHYEQKYRERVVKGLHRRAAEFGFTLQPAEGVS
uniref:hypothetical protein n=1 Tax=Pseudomonas chlororaphis TaxID=587753 RepID=UPI002155C237|nr:hypothetical protein [Pseudomonas chlororaphis]